MAVVILFGLLSSTALNMVVVPAVYFRFGRSIKELKSGYRGGSGSDDR